MIAYLRRMRDIRTKNSKATDEANRELSLFVQFLIIFIVYFLYYESFWFTEKFASIDVLPRSIVQVITGSLLILNSSVNPFLYMKFSSSMKAALKDNPLLKPARHRTGLKEELESIQFTRRY